MVSGKPLDPKGLQTIRETNSSPLEKEIPIGFPTIFRFDLLVSGEGHLLKN